MSLVVIVSGVLVFYFIIWFFDSFFKSCMHYPYYAFLEGTGLKIGCLNFSWKTTAFNRLIFRWAKKGSNFFKKFYTCGYLFAIFIFLPFSILVLVSTVIAHLWPSDIGHATAEVQTVIPGVNLPNEDLWAYFIALAVSSVIHELGHAIAAVQEDVQLLTVGLYMITVIPIAFVELSTEQLNSITVTRRLKIYCAGVWHNVTCGLIAFLLFLSVPSVFKFGYQVGTGVKVTDFRQSSPLAGSRGLAIGDHITRVNDCKVKDNRDWQSCIFTTTAERFGLCVTSEFVSNNDEIVVISYKENDLVDCCRPDNKHSLCFEYMENKRVANSPAQYSCLKPREIIREQFVKCTSAYEHLCPNDQHCLKPLLGNQTYLFVIDRIDKATVLYIGSPFDLYYTVMIDHYIPKYNIFSILSPHLIEKILEYIFMFSMGIGIINIVPCFGTDGHHIARNVIQWTALRYNNYKEFVNVITFCVVSLGTLLTVPILMYLFLKSIMNAFHV